MLIGAVVASICLSLFTPWAEMTSGAKILAQTVAGTFIGCSVTREDILGLKGAGKLVGVVLGAFLSLNLLLGVILARVTSLDLITALLATVPGGVNDVSLMAADMGADVSVVVVLQFVRLCAGIGVFPLWIAAMDRRHPEADIKGEATDACPRSRKTAVHSLPANLIALAVGGLFGTVGRSLGIPSGTLMFSLLGTLLIKLRFYPICLHPAIRRCAQVLSGAYIGCSVSRDSLFQLPSLLVPAVGIVLAYMLYARIISRVLMRIGSIPFKEAMLMLTPAGASDMALISADIGVQSSTLIAVHISRLIVAAAVLPQLWYLLSQMVS